MDEISEFLQALDNEIVESAALTHRRSRRPLVRRETAGASALRQLIAPQEPNAPTAHGTGFPSTAVQPWFGPVRESSMALAESAPEKDHPEVQKKVETDKRGEVHPGRDTLVRKSRR